MNQSPESVKTISLNWLDPICLAKVPTLEPDLQKQFNIVGVYVWTIRPADGPEYLAYVGRATQSTRVLERLRNHYLSQIGGRYIIPAGFRDCENQEAPSKMWSVNWRDSASCQVLANRDEFVKLVDAGFAVVKASYVSAALVHPTDVRDVERQLLYELQPTDTQWGTRSPPSRALKLLHGSPRWASPQVRANILGARATAKPPLPSVPIEELGFE